MAFGAVLSALLGDFAIRAAVLVVVVLSWLALTLALLASRNKLKAKVELHRGLLSRYCDVIWDGWPTRFRIIRWEQVAVIEENGDTEEIITVQAKVEGADARFFRLRFGAGWDQPESYRKNVTTEVRNLLVDGTSGTSWDVTSYWLDDGRLNMLSHFHTPAEVGSSVRVQMKWRWPGKSIPLMVRRQPDLFTFRFGNPVEYASYRVILPKGFDAHFDAVNLDRKKHDFTIKRKDSTGRLEVELKIRNMPIDVKIGMRLEIKK
ncbi:hypothetical protein CLV43_103633 [Umezawaea tangerina]|uniref:Uncharacterized protein n=2 Tax=Umezawaea tangerina TaxID=84725 RepID=A0A2T0TE30_9PSEU|nr:hypothetical protein CLV43_103633 [Umezawaea tangerina]